MSFASERDTTSIFQWIFVTQAFWEHSLEQLLDHSFTTCTEMRKVMKNCLPITGLLDVDKLFSMLVRMLHNEHYHRYILYIMLSPFPIE